MNAFDHCQTIEAEGYRLLRPYLEKTFDEFVYVQGARRAEFLYRFQTNYGDLIVKKDNTLVFIDVKTEKKDIYGNFFFETWSNKSRNTPGWFMEEGGVKADYIFYVFLEPPVLYIIDLPKARTWAFSANRLCAYPERRQAKYDQLNDTWGRCVRIGDVVREGFVRRVCLGAAGA